MGSGFVPPAKSFLVPCAIVFGVCYALSPAMACSKVRDPPAGSRASLHLFFDYILAGRTGVHSPRPPAALGSALFLYPRVWLLYLNVSDRMPGFPDVM
jgi:hypothetical protein